MLHSQDMIYVMDSAHIWLHNLQTVPHLYGFDFMDHFYLLVQNKQLAYLLILLNFITDLSLFCL